jgi:hypothetical protein
MNAEDVWPDVKRYIENRDLASLKWMYEELLAQQATQTEYKFNTEWVWKHAYLHSIIKKQPHIEEWLLSLYEEMPLLDRIGLKPTLMYAKYLRR